VRVESQGELSAQFGGEPEPARRAAGAPAGERRRVRPVGRYPFQACFKTSPHPAKYYEVACNRFGSRGAVRRFTDAIGWYPGYEYRPDLNAASPLFRDADASVTGHVAGTGNPRDGTPTNPTDLSLGVKLRVKRASSKAAQVVVRPGHRTR
jgi:hypothetical protein